jgi:PAS domain S-box-containing protein
VKGFESVASGIDPADDAGPVPDAAELTAWLLDGRFFTVDPEGAITSWSPFAAGAFGWRRQDVVGKRFADTLLAPPERQAALPAGSNGAAGYTGGVEAVDATERTLRAEFAFVPIQLSMGYEFNSLLQEISARSPDPDALAEMKVRHDSVLSLIEGALAGREVEGDRPAGMLVLFRAGAAAAAAVVAGDEEDAPVADNVVSIADAAGTEEARAQLDRARRVAEDGRVEIRSLEGQLEEARREAGRARNEADVARQEVNDSRDVLIVTQRGAEEVGRQLEDARRATDEVRGAAEAARIRSEEAQREADSLRAQLREARDSVRGMAGRADDELAEAQERAALAARELAEARAEVARHEAEVAPLRERYQEAQREFGALRADLESARATAAERETVGERRAADLERTRTELGARTSEALATREEVEKLRGELEARVAVAAVARNEAEARMAEIAEVRAEMEASAAEAAAADAQIEQLRGELEAARSGAAPESAAPDHELAAVRERLERMRAAFDRAPVGGALIAPDGRYLEVSDSLCHTLGYPRERFLSGEPPAIVHPDDVDAHRDLARRLLAGEQAGARGYRRYLHAEGHALTMRESVSLVRDDEGRPSMFVVQLEEAHAGDHAEGVVVDADVDHDEDAAGTRTDAPEAALTGDAMRRALEDDLFELHCQPVLDLCTNVVTQYELLIRMRAGDGRLILPQAFLGPARRAGLAHSIDRWVVRQAIRLLHETEDVSLEVNLSPEAVHDPDLPAMIDEELAGTPIDPARLVLEVTGATAIAHLEETRALAKSLRGLGCRFALDDFRSNFGSFRLVRELPLDYLKLDGELVESLAESRTSQLIVKALVDVAAGTGMKTIAVFVSDEQTLTLLRQLGVAYAQGYIVGRPTPVVEALRVEPPQLPAG